LIKCIGEATAVYRDKKKWGALVRKSMEYNFSWDESAKKYIQSYEKARA